MLKPMLGAPASEAPRFAAGTVAGGDHVVAPAVLGSKRAAPLRGDAAELASGRIEFGLDPHPLGDLRVRRIAGRARGFLGLFRRGNAGASEDDDGGADAPIPECKFGLSIDLISSRSRKWVSSTGSR